MADTNNTTNLKSRIDSHLGGLTPHTALASHPSAESAEDEIAKAKVFSHIEGREAYIAWVAGYKALIQDLESHIKELKEARNSADVWVQAHAQSQSHHYAIAVTSLIQMRRLGKTWSAAQAQRRKKKAA